MPRQTPLFGFNLFAHNEPVISLEDIAPDAIYNGAVQPDASKSLNYNFKRMDFVLQSILSGQTAFTSLRTTQDVIAGRDVVVGRDLNVKGSILLPRDNRPTPHVIFDFGDALINSGLGTNGTVTFSKGGSPDTSSERLKPFSSSNDGALIQGTSAYPVVLNVTKAAGFFDTSLDAYFRLFLAFDKVPQNLSQIVLELSYDNGLTYPVLYSFASTDALGSASFLSEPLELSSTQKPSGVRLTLQGTGASSVNFSLRRFATLSGATPALDGFFLAKGGGSVYGALNVEGGVTSTAGTFSGLLSATGSLSGFEAIKLKGKPFDDANYPGNLNPDSVTVQTLLDGLRRSVNNIIDNTVGVFQSIDTADLDVSGQAVFGGTLLAPSQVSFATSGNGTNSNIGLSPDGAMFYLNRSGFSDEGDADLTVRDLRPRSVLSPSGPLPVYDSPGIAQGIKIKNGLFSDSYATEAIRRVDVLQSVASGLDGVVIRSATTSTKVAGQLWAGDGGFVIDARLGDLTGATQLNLQTGGIDRVVIDSAALTFKNGTKLALGDSLKGLYAGRVKAVAGASSTTRLPAGWSLINYGTSIVLVHGLGTDAFAFQAMAQDATITCTTSVDTYGAYVYFKRISDGAAMNAVNFTFTAALY